MGYPAGGGGGGSGALLPTISVNLSGNKNITTHVNVYFTDILINLGFPYTGRFIMYSVITKIYYRKTAGHVFTKPVQIEGTNQKSFFPVSYFSS